MVNESQRKLALKRLLSDGRLSEADITLLSAPDDFQKQLMSCGLMPQSSSARFEKFRSVHEALQTKPFTVELEELWSRYIPLTEILIGWSVKRQTTIVGIAGVPGTGKTSLAGILSTIANTIGVSTLAVSLDDFYLSPSEREQRGYRWRAVPGTHDLVLLQQFLSEVRSDRADVHQPHYDTSAERRLPPTITPKPRLLLFEGWFIGARVKGYEVLCDELDYLIYLDCELEWAHQSRVERERRIRAESNGQSGLSEADTERFWEEALLPGALDFVVPLASRADLVLKTSSYHLDSVTLHGSSF